MNPLAKRPWLLVILAFLLLIGAWVATISIATRTPNKRLTPAEEADLLRARAELNK